MLPQSFFGEERRHTLDALGVDLAQLLGRRRHHFLGRLALFCSKNPIKELLGMNMTDFPKHDENQI